MRLSKASISSLFMMKVMLISHKNVLLLKYLSMSFNSKPLSKSLSPKSVKKNSLRKINRWSMTKSTKQNSLSLR